MSEIVDRPIAIGYLVTLSPELIEIIKNILPETEHDNIPESVHIATKFVTGQRGMTKENVASAEDLVQWYKRKRGSVYNTYISELLVSPKKTLIVTVANCNGEKTYGILYNKKNIATTHLKKSISSGQHNLLKITFERLTMNCEPYILKVPHRKFIWGWGDRKRIIYDRITH